MIPSEAITNIKPSNAATIVRKTLRVCAVNPSGNITGANNAKYFDARAFLFRILSKKNRKKEVEMIVISVMNIIYVGSNVLNSIPDIAKTHKYRFREDRIALRE